MNINLDLLLSQMEDGDSVAKLFDLAHSPEARFQALQDLIESSKVWRVRVNSLLAMKTEGDSDGELLDWLIDDLDLHFGSLRINARFARSMLPPEKLRAYEEGFGFMLKLQEQHEEQKRAEKPKRLKKAKRKP